MNWSDIAKSTIERIALTIPEDATFTERKKQIDAAYPFGVREYWPYKAWLKARKAYLRRYDPKPPQAPLFSTFSHDPVSGRPIIT